jgi:carbon storage regulator
LPYFNCKIGDRIRIGPDILLTVADIRDDKARIGTDAPKSVPVHRQEIYEAIRRGDFEARKA